MRLGAQDYLVKGRVDGPGLLRSIRYAIERKRSEEELIDVVHRLERALSQVKRLSGLLPICAACKKIRDDHGYWSEVEVYIHDHTDADFTHGICPDCRLRLYPGL